MTPLMPTRPAVADSDHEGAAIARQQVTYTCRNAHPTVLTFAADALLPLAWDCKRCGLPGGLNPAAPPADPVVVEVFKTHLDYAQERRTPAEADALIVEHIARMRAMGL